MQKANRPGQTGRTFSRATPEGIFITLSSALPKYGMVLSDEYWPYQPSP